MKFEDCSKDILDSCGNDRILSYKDRNDLTIECLDYDP